MENHTKVLPPEILLEEYRRLLRDEKIQSLPLVITGNSMSPFLVHGRDTVFLSRLDRDIKKGDILLYRRDSGAYILHRVYKAGEELTFVGDGQAAFERGIKRDRVIAVAESAVRKGKTIQKGCLVWDFFEKVWINFVPVRMPIIKIYSFLFHGK